MSNCRPFRLWALLLVLVVALQALAPSGGGLSLRSGSAFSADTVEVAVAPMRRAAEATVAPLPVPPPAAVPAAKPEAVQAVVAAYPKPRQTAPPRRNAAISRTLEPRAPPLA